MKAGWYINLLVWFINTLMPIQNGRYFSDDILKCIFLNANVSIPIKISMNFIPNSLINEIRPLVKMLAWCRQSGKPLSEPMMVTLLTHICLTGPQWVKPLIWKYALMFVTLYAPVKHQVGTQNQVRWVNALTSFVIWLPLLMSWVLFTNRECGSLENRTLISVYIHIILNNIIMYAWPILK